MNIEEQRSATFIVFVIAFALAWWFTGWPPPPNRVTGAFTLRLFC